MWRWSDSETQRKGCLDWEFKKLKMTEANSEALLIAIKESNFEQVCALLEAGANPNVKDYQGCYALIIACELGNINIVDVLLASNVYLLIQGYDALWIAAINGYVNVVKALIAEGVPANNMLVYAYKQGQIKAAKTFLDAGVKFNGWYISFELHDAASTGNTEIIKKLISIGVNVDERDYEKKTPLMTAATYGNLEVVKLLVKYGADVNAWVKGDTPLLNAAYKGEKEVYDYLYPLVSRQIRKLGRREIARGMKYRERKQRIDIENFIYAAMIAQDEAVQAAIKRGIDINAIGSNGQTALMYAAFYGHISTVKILIKAGANLDILSDEDFAGTAKTALIFASNRHEVIKILAKAGANVNMRSPDGLTTLMYAAMCGDSTAVEALIEANADLNIRDNRGNTAIMYAKSRKFDAVFNLLKQAGASEEGLDEFELNI